MCEVFIKNVNSYYIAYFSKCEINSMVFEKDKYHLFRIIENGRYLLEKAFPEEIYQK